MMKFNTFVNQWGCEEKYIAKSIESHRTGHVNYGSMFETDSTCGNCDGGRCNSCTEIFTVYQYGEPYIVIGPYGLDEQKQNVLLHKFTNKAEAEAFYDSLQ